MAWTNREITRLKQLASSRQLFFSEIAEKLGKTPAAVRHRAHQLGIFYKVPERMGKWNEKHAHLRGQAMRYYLTHSFEETREHFGLTRSNMKSLLTVCYRLPEYRHLRKEWRPHSAWSSEDWRFMVKTVGIQPREWIARKLKRGETYNSVKDALAKFRGYGKYMNGMPIGWAMHLFDDRALELKIKTKAGPTGGDRGCFHYRIIPWVTCERLIREGRTRPLLGKGKCTASRKRTAPRVKVSEEVKSGVRAMAEFQRWIYGTRSERRILKQIHSVLRRK